EHLESDEAAVVTRRREHRSHASCAHETLQRVHAAHDLPHACAHALGDLGSDGRRYRTPQRDTSAASRVRSVRIVVGRAMEERDLDERAARRLGSTLRGKYRLDELLGSGGMAAVYKGSHRNGHQVAIKVLHPELSVLASVRKQFLQEGYKTNAV